MNNATSHEMYISQFNCRIVPYAQTTWSQSSDSKSIIDSKRNTEHNALMFSFDYASNTNLLGNYSSEIRQPSFSPSLSFLSGLGMDLSLTGNFVANSDDSLENFSSEFDLMLGYNFKPFKNLTVYPNYTRYLYSRNSNPVQTIFRNDFRLDIDYKYRFIDLGVTSGYFTGDQHTFYADVRNSYEINFEHVVFRNSFLTLNPGIDANFGSYEYLNMFYLSNLKSNPNYIFYLLRYSPAFSRYVLQEKYYHPELTVKEIVDNYLQQKAQDNFKLSSVSLFLPVYYLLGDFGINLGVFVFIPVHQPDYLSGDVLFYFTLGVSYNIDL